MICKVDMIRIMELKRRYEGVNVDDELYEELYEELVIDDEIDLPGYDASVSETNGLM